MYVETPHLGVQSGGFVRYYSHGVGQHSGCPAVFGCAGINGIRKQEGWLPWIKLLWIKNGLQ
jgi:hypothetical protein